MENDLCALWKNHARASEELRLNDPENKKHMETWLKLRKELYDRITDEETRQLLHELETTELELTEAAEFAAFRVGFAWGAARGVGASGNRNE